MESWLASNGHRFDRVMVVGGAAAVSDLVTEQLADALSGPAVELPTPADVPDGTSPFDLANRIATAADPGEAAGLLMTALTRSGLTVVDGQGAVNGPPSGTVSQGIALTAVELAALALAPTASTDVSLADLGTFVVDAFDDAEALSGIDAGTELQAALAAHAADQSSPLQDFAKFLQGIGQAADVPHDLLVDDPTTIRLTVVELTLISRRLAADLLVELDSSERTAFQQTAGAASPCAGIIDPGSWAFDVGAIALSTGNSLLTTKFADALGGFVGKAANILGIAALVTAIAQMVMTLHAYEWQVAYQGGSTEPLVRTRTTTPGEQRVVEVSVRNRDTYDGLTVVNCFRPIFNILGLDLSFPAAGPLANVGVAFELPDQSLVQPYRNPSDELLTDTDGRARWAIEGRGQVENLGPDVVPADQMVPIDIGITLKTSDATKNLTDAFGLAVSGGLAIATGGGWVAAAGILITLASELVQRTSLFTTRQRQIPVRDWVEICLAPDAGGGGGPDSPPSPPPGDDTGGPPAEPAPAPDDHTCDSDLYGTIVIEDRVTLRSEPGVSRSGTRTDRITYQVAMEAHPNGAGGYVYLDEETTFDTEVGGSHTFVNHNACPATHSYSGLIEDAPSEFTFFMDENDGQHWYLEIYGSYPVRVDVNSCEGSYTSKQDQPMNSQCDPRGYNQEGPGNRLVGTLSESTVDQRRIRTFDFACVVTYQRHFEDVTVSVTGTLTHAVSN